LSKTTAKSRGHLLKVSVTYIQTSTGVAVISRFLCLWFPMSSTMFMVGIATHFLGIFTVFKFAFGI